MAENFKQSAKRHFDGAGLLKQNGANHLANASHLYGLSAECALKAILAGTHCNFPFKHIDAIWPQFITLLNGRGKAPYAAILTCSMPNPFHSYQITHRYYDESSIPLGDIPTYEEGALAAMIALETAEINGDVV